MVLRIFVRPKQRGSEEAQCTRRVNVELISGCPIVLLQHFVGLLSCEKQGENLEVVVLRLSSEVVLSATFSIFCSHDVKIE